MGGHHSPFTPPHRLPALEAFRVVTPRPDRCRDPGLFLVAICQGFHFSPLRAPCLDSPSVRAETEGRREGGSGESGATWLESRAGPSSGVALSTPDPIFHFLCEFSPVSVQPRSHWFCNSIPSLDFRTWSPQGCCLWPCSAYGGDRPFARLRLVRGCVLCEGRAGSAPPPATRPPAPGTRRGAGSHPARTLCVWAACSKHASGPSGQGACSLGGWPQAVLGLLSSPLLLG